MWRRIIDSALVSMEADYTLLYRSEDTGQSEAMFAGPYRALLIMTLFKTSAGNQRKKVTFLAFLPETLTYRQFGMIFSVLHCAASWYEKAPAKC